MSDERPESADELAQELADVASVEDLTPLQLDKLLAALPEMSVEAAKKLADQVPALRDLVVGTLRMVERTHDRAAESLDQGHAKQHELYEKLIAAIDDERKQPDLTPAERHALLEDMERVVDKAEVAKEKHSLKIGEMFKTAAAVGGAAIVAVVMVVGVVAVAKNGDLKLDSTS